MSEINVNTPTNNVPSSEPIVKSGGENTVSFDDLEAVMDQPKIAKGKKSQEDEPKEKIDSKKDKSQDEEYETDESVDDSGDKKTKGKENGKEDQKDQKTSKEVSKKVYKVKLGEKQIDLPSDLELDHTVGGQKVKVKLQELLNEYAGKTEWDSRYTKLAESKKSFEGERASLQNVVDTFYNLGWTQKNGRAAVEYLAEVMGTDPVDTYKTFIKNTQDQWEALSKLSPEERMLKERDEELNHYKNKEQHRKQTESYQKDRSMVESRVTSVIQKFGIDKATFSELYHDLKASGSIKDEDLTPEVVGQYHDSLQKFRNLRELTKDVDPDMQSKITNELADVWQRNPELSIDDIKDIAKQVFGSKSVRNLSNKVKKAAPENTVKPSKSRQENPITFDDLND